MKIPLPCNFGEQAECNGRLLPLNGVSWFIWESGVEYYYFFKKNDVWHPTEFYSTFETDQPLSVEISDHLLSDGFLKEKGFPVKGRGYATGLFFANNKLYIDLILSDFSNRHLKVECDRDGNYVENGDIVFPPSADTIEKKERFLLKRLPSKRESLKKGEGEC